MVFVLFLFFGLHVLQYHTRNHSHSHKPRQRNIATIEALRITSAETAANDHERQRTTTNHKTTTTMTMRTTPVTYNDATKSIPIDDATIAPFLTRVQNTFALCDATFRHLCLAFQTVDGDCAAVTTDFALRLAVGTPLATGALVLVSCRELPTVDQCIRTVFKAVVDSAAKRDAAAVFLALSGAWERAVREVGDAALAAVVDDSVSLPPPSPSSFPCASPASIPCSVTPSPSPSSTAIPASTLPSQTQRLSQIHAQIPSDSINSTASSAPPRPASAMHGLSNGMSKTLRAAVTRSLDDSVSADVAKTVADAAMSRVDECASDEISRWEAMTTAAAEIRALDCFCTHSDVSCSHCHIKPITGTRYRSCGSLGNVQLQQIPQQQQHHQPNANTGVAGVNSSTSSSALLAVVPSSQMALPGGFDLCERCRRGLADQCLDDDFHFVMYDHPWEASEEYASIRSSGSDEDDGGGGFDSPGDTLRAPPPPLRQGDVGPRVLHLHYLLYKIGYLSVGGKMFKPGVFCSGTNDAITRFQSDHWCGGMANDLGVYNVVSRSVLLSLLDELDRRAANIRCSAVSGAEEPRLRMALAA